MSELIEKKKNSHSAHSFIAGSLSGLASTFIGQPFDTVKVLMQTDHVQYPTTIKTIQNIVRVEGFTALYKGGLPPLLSSLVTTSMSFGVYYNSLSYIQNFFGHDKPTYSDISYAGAMSAFVNCFIVTPSDSIKTKLQTQHGHSLYSSNFDCFRKVLATQGIRKGLYRGFFLKMLTDVPGIAVYFLTFEAFKEMFGTSKLSILNAGGLAGCLGWISVYPVDLIRSRIQALPIKPTPGWDKYTGMIDCTKKTYAEGGIRTFYRGMVSCCIRAYPVNAFRFLAYNWIVTQLELI
jgi:solute carrier family 25 carnitine/acylcarnitine transporter 20/29